MAAKPCSACGVRPKAAGRHKCVWCWTATLPMMAQVAAAERRLEISQAREGYEYRARVKQSEWPPGKRWCAGCQWFVPLDQVAPGASRCRACASRAAHASKISSLYDITGEQYALLYAWQDGRCFICGKRTKIRLAVDHDHATGAVRGLLCANDEWGCNVALRVILDDLDAARRLVRYIQRAPLERMEADEEKPFTREVNHG